MTQSSARYVPLISCCAVFIFFAALIASQGQLMFGDSDPFWHIAAGDLIRARASVPLTDPWSFTAGDYRWLNISWAWDTGFSYVHERLGWHGVAALNALIIAAAVTLTYGACLARSGDGIASFLTALAVLTMLPVYLRPLQVTELMTALWMLILSGVLRDRYRQRLLILLPVTMLLWVNCHGGFLIGPLLLAAFLAQALWQRQYALARRLCYAGIATAAALLANPYGIWILEAAWRPLTTTANHYLNEWQPFKASTGQLLTHGYALLFLCWIPGRPLPVLPVERWLSYLWLLFGLLCIRHMPIFAVVSAPLFACRLHESLSSRKTPGPNALALRRLALCLARRETAAFGLLLCLAFSLWLISPMAGRAYGQERFALPTFSQELAFIETHYPDIRLINDMDIGGLIDYESQGRVRVFIDSRTETAFPSALLDDYGRFGEAAPEWDAIFDRYKIDGVMLANGIGFALADRFSSRRGWKLLFKGPTASIFVREPFPHAGK